MSVANWIALASAVAALGAFLSGYLQYVKAQKWKRAEFVAKEIKEFESNTNVRIATTILDWEERRYVIGPGEGEKGIVINDEVLVKALRPHDRSDRFTRVEVFIRDVFDSYFEGLERFSHFIDSALVSPSEFRPYLIYWIEIIGDPKNSRKSTECREAIWNYLIVYGYTGVIRLLASYGYDIKAPAVQSGGD